MAAMTPPPDLEEPPNDILLDPRTPPDGVSVWHDDGPSHELPDGFEEEQPHDLDEPEPVDDESEGVQEGQERRRLVLPALDQLAVGRLGHWQSCP